MHSHHISLRGARTSAEMAAVHSPRWPVLGMGIILYLNVACTCTLVRKCRRPALLLSRQCMQWRRRIAPCMHWNPSRAKYSHSRHANSPLQATTMSLSGKQSMSIVFPGERSRYVTLSRVKQKHGAPWRGEMECVVCSGSPR